MEVKRDATHTSDRIVAALRRLWDRNESPSLDDVAYEAGIGIATLYRHFPNRRALEKEALIDALHDDLEAILNAAESGGPFVIRNAVDLVDAILGHLQSLSGAGMVDAIDDILHQCADRLGAALVLGKEQGMVREDLSEHDLFWLLRMLVLGLQHPDATPEIRRRLVGLLTPVMHAPTNCESDLSQL